MNIYPYKGKNLLIKKWRVKSRPLLIWCFFYWNFRIPLKTCFIIIFRFPVRKAVEKFSCSKLIFNKPPIVLAVNFRNVIGRFCSALFRFNAFYCISLVSQLANWLVPDKQLYWPRWNFGKTALENPNTIRLLLRPVKRTCIASIVAWIINDTENYIGVGLFYC